jgi:hypothetical protein
MIFLENVTSVLYAGCPCTFIWEPLCKMTSSRIALKFIKILATVTFGSRFFVFYSVSTGAAHSLIWVILFFTFYVQSTENTSFIIFFQQYKKWMIQIQIIYFQFKYFINN